MNKKKRKRNGIGKHVERERDGESKPRHRIAAAIPLFGNASATNKQGQFHSQISPLGKNRHDWHSTKWENIYTNRLATVMKKLLSALLMLLVEFLYAFLAHGGKISSVVGLPCFGLAMTLRMLWRDEFAIIIPLVLLFLFVGFFSRLRGNCISKN